jgi:hypothetical protein
MLTLNKKHLFLLFFICAPLFSQDQSFSLMNMIDPYKNSYIKTDETNEILRAFDLNTGSTAATVTTLVISSTGYNTNDGQSCDWHPSGQWLACVGVPPIAGAIFDFSAAGTVFYHINPQNAINHAGTLYSTRWHPSGNYLAYAGNTASGIQGRVVFFDTKTGYKSVLNSSANIILGANARAVEWSPDGKYLTVGGFGVSNVDHVKTFSFDGYTLWALPNGNITYSPQPAGNVQTLHWHPSGKYLAIGGTSASGTAISTQVYYFNQQSQSFYLLPGCNTIFGDTVRGVHWHPSGGYLALSGERNNNINIRTYSFSGQSLSETSSIHSGSLALDMWTNDCKWSPDGAYLAIGEIPLEPGVVPPGDAQYLRVFSFLENKLKEVASYNHIDDVRGIAWSPDGRFISICGDPSDGNTVILRLISFTEPIDLIQKKQKKELIKIKNMLAATSAALPQLYETVLSTSALLDSTISFSIESFTTVTSFLINGITGASQPSFDWHPSKDLIAVSSANNNYIYFYNGVIASLVDSTVTTQPIATTDITWDIKWSPRGDFLISGGWRDYIHSFDNVNLTQLSSKYDHLFNGIEWDKSGNFVFCCEQRTTPTTSNNAPGQLSAYYFDGTSLTKMTSTGDLEYSTQMSINYNNHLVAKGGNKGKVNIYAFDPLTTNTLSFVQSLNQLTTSFSTVIFHPTQDILFVNTDTQIRAFSINGTFTTELLGCQVSAAGALFLDFDATGKYLLVSFSDKFIVFKFDGAILTEVIRYSSGSDVLTGAKWSYDGKKIATLVDTGSTVFLRILQVNFNRLTDSKPDLLQETSNALVALATLARTNSNAIVTLNTLNINTSNSLLSDALTVANSNALSGLLVRTSQAVNTLLIQDSQAIVSINTLTEANSNSIITELTLAQANSNTLVTYQPLIINTSNAINGLLVATSDAVSGLLIATSNATAGLLVATSNATAGLLVTTSYAATNLAQKLISLNTIDIGPAHIHFNAPTITMSYNVLISTDHQLFVHASGVVNGNGHSITFAKGNGTFFTIDPGITTTFQNVIFKDYNDASVLLGADASLIFGQSCRVELGEPQTLSRTWSFAGQSLLDAHNNSITVGTGAHYLSSLVSSSLTIANASLLNVRDNNLRTADNNAALIFNNAQLNLSSDFTYSTGSMLINNDVVLRGTSIFNYSTIMGLTVSSQSKLTIDQGTTFNYTPAGNFRNLLSLTDSSATLFFNNASLVATATGARLTKGTLLIDGIMNIQSSAASQAEAIIFGDGTPTNDLIITFLPNATINLLSGFLNYANTQ